MFERTLEKLELPKVIELVAEHTSFAVSRELAFDMWPADDAAMARHLQRLTSEGRMLLDSRASFSAAGAQDIRDPVRRASLGAVLDPNELLDIATTLTVSRAVKGAISKAGPAFSGLAQIVESITPFDELVLEIKRCIDPHGEVVDDASPILKRLRSESRLAHQRLVSRLEAILNSSKMKLMIQEPIVTVRDGRYVIPVKADFKGQFRGIVHDHSASGATIFVEPLATVDLNNRWRELQLQEEREVHRILKSLSNQISVGAEAIAESLAALAEIDLILAKARYSLEIEGTEPILVSNEEARSRDGCVLDVKRARHPLLKGGVVPIDVYLGGEFLILVITGPNTGGKTVALKTIGLLAMMAQCGLHIPADEGSKVRVFRSVYADIGDEQSIEQSLSTFSSHMKNIIQVLKRADEDSLVLLDELGAGTDPAEGSALARSILSFLIRRRIPALATTHYSELKTYAHATEGIENASVEFDPETLAPTYRLAIGLPGRSNALSIAARLGVPREVIDEAQGFINPAEPRVDNLLQEIQRERDRAVLDRRAAESIRQGAEELERSLREEKLRLLDERESILVKAREEAEGEIAEIRRKLRAAEDLIRNPVADRRASMEGLREAIAEVSQAQRELEKKMVQAERSPEAPEYISDASFQAGDYVLVRSLDQHGEVVSSLADRGEVEVSLGNFKVRVKARDVIKTRGRPRAAGAHLIPPTTVPCRPSPPSEIEVRGWRVEEVLPVLDQYIDDAYLAGMTSVRIIHGKGTGVLRQVVREQLARHPLVRSFVPAVVNEGGDGVTVAALAS